jgi:hypothetical protein
MNWPSDRQVVQRNANNLGLVSVLGDLEGPASTVEVRAMVHPGGSGQAVGWSPLKSFAEAPDGTFTGWFALSAGGWYTLVFRAINRGRIGPTFTVNHVGVGEVFIVAGQSNATNSGELDPTFQPSDRISSFNGNVWVHAANPLPFAFGGGGNAWDYMAQQLEQVLNVPIGLESIAIGSTSIEQWQPGQVLPPAYPTLIDGGHQLFATLTRAILTLQPRGGVRAVLWNQGESDKNTSIPVYQALLTNLILQSRQATGVNVMWGITLNSLDPRIQTLQPGQDPTDLTILPATIRRAQVMVARTVPNVIMGPTMDDLGEPYRVPPQYAHLNVLGESTIGTRWADVLLTVPGIVPVRSSVKARG